MATNNAINNTSNPLASTAVTIDPGAAGDSYVQYNINATGEWRVGADDDAGDSYKISQGSALGTNDTFIMTAAGELRMPLQPAFLAYLASADNNVTGNGTTYTLGTNVALTEVFDQGSDFNTNGTFTAPITGRYMLSASAQLTGLSVATGLTIGLATTARTYSSGNGRAASSVNVGNVVSALTSMDAGDTCTVEIIGTGEAGATADLVGSSSPSTWFSGYLAV